MELELNRLRMECMAEDTVAGRIQDYLDKLEDNYVCTLQIFKEGLDHPYDEPKRSDTNEINEIMNNVVIGWKPGQRTGSVNTAYSGHGSGLADGRHSRRRAGRRSRRSAEAPRPNLRFGRRRFRTKSDI
jgi:hypothetical protein